MLRDTRELADERQALAGDKPITAGSYVFTVGR